MNDQATNQRGNGLRAPHGKRGRGMGTILPRDDGAAPLDIVIAVMAFLAALALAASLIADRAALGWREGLAGRVTVQVLPPDSGPPGPELERQTRAAIEILSTTPGIVHVARISHEDALKLVEPWLGADALVADLPLPNLVDASIRPGARVDLAGLRARLKESAPSAVLDDHTHWIARLKALADVVIWSGYGILLLIAVATAAAVTFATRAGLEAHREIVGLLHQMGAHPGFIARAFERHYFFTALIAAAAGAGAAAILFLLAGGLELAGVEAVPFLPPIALKPAEALWFIAVPVASALIAWATARISVLAALRKIY
jgi:cell division transport system permease protein